MTPDPRPLNVERPCHPPTTHRYRRVGQSNILCCVRCGQGKQDIVGIPPQSDSHAALVEAAREVQQTWDNGLDSADDDGFIPGDEWEAMIEAQVALRTALDGEPR
jgi:hypothetical protein